jgi:hypothetical protein
MVACGAVWPAPASRGRKRPAGEVQVSERQQREHLRTVLDDAAIAHLAVAELAFHDALDFRAHLAEPVIAGTLLDRQLASRLRLLLRCPLDAGLLGRALPLVGLA